MASLGKSLEPHLDKIMVLFVGVLFLALGLLSFIDPGIFKQLYGIEAGSPSAAIALRAIIGGGEIGLGLFMLFGGMLSVPLRSRLVLAAFVFGGVCIARAVAIMMSWPVVADGSIREMAIEGVIAISFWLRLFVSTCGDVTE